MYTKTDINVLCIHVLKSSQLNHGYQFTVLILSKCTKCDQESYMGVDADVLSQITCEQ